MWPLLIASITNALVQVTVTSLPRWEPLTWSSCFYLCFRMHSPQSSSQNTYLKNQICYTPSISLGVKTNSLQSKILDNPPYQIYCVLRVSAFAVSCLHSRCCRKSTLTPWPTWGHLQLWNTQTRDLFLKHLSFSGHGVVLSLHTAGQKGPSFNEERQYLGFLIPR